MNKTIIYALVQLIKLFLFSIFKHRIPIEKYLFQSYLVLNFSLPFNNLSIQTFWQIGLHKAVSLRMFLCRASSSCCVRNSLSEIPPALASSLLSMRL